MAASRAAASAKPGSAPPPRHPATGQRHCPRPAGRQSRQPAGACSPHRRPPSAKARDSSSCSPAASSRRKRKLPSSSRKLTRRAALAAFFLPLSALFSGSRREQADCLAQLGDEWGGDAARLGGTGEENVLDIVGLGDQRLVTLASLAQFVVEQLEQALLGFAPGQAVEQLLAERGDLFGAGEGRVKKEQVRTVRVFRLARRARVGDDARWRP